MTAATHVLVANNLPISRLRDLLPVAKKDWRDRLLANVADPLIASFFRDEYDQYNPDEGKHLGGSTMRRLFDRRMGELPQNTSTSVTTMAEYRAPELTQRHFPQRFEALPPAIFLEHSVEERTPQGRLGRKPTWDRLSCHSWTPRRVWLSGQERIAFGDPHWKHLPEHEVEALLGREEMQARNPRFP